MKDIRRFLRFDTAVIIPVTVSLLIGTALLIGIPMLVRVTLLITVPLLVRTALLIIISLLIKLIIHIFLSGSLSLSDFHLPYPSSGLSPGSPPFSVPFEAFY